MKYLERFILFSSLVLILAVSAVMVKDIPVWKLFLVTDIKSLDFSVLISKQTDPLGQVSFMSSSGLKRKTLEEGYFNNLKMRDSVFNGDIITTDAITRAVIKFQDGGELEIQPQSMVKIDFSVYKEGLLSIAKTPKVEVLTGSVKGTGGKKQLEISDLDGKVLPSNGEDLSKPVVKVFNNKLSSDKVAKLNLPKRSVAQLPPTQPEPVAPVAIPTPPVPNPSIKNSPESVLPKVEQFQVVKPQPKKQLPPPLPNPMRQVAMEPHKIAGLSTLKDNTYQGEDLRNFFVDLKWEAYPEATGYVLNFYKDVNKSQLWFSTQTPENHYRLTQIFNGQVFYEVKAVKGSKQIGNSTVQNLNFNYKGPALKNPKTNSQLDAESVNYFFTWEKTNFTDKYILEISKDPSFSQKAYRKTVEQNFVQIPLLKGTYYWRVYSVQGEVTSSSSIVNTLFIK